MSNISASPKVVKLDAAIKTERDPVKRACLKAERAGFVGRLGDFEAGTKGIAAIRAELGTNVNAKVTAWLKIAESWIAHFEGTSQAKSHMVRAYALSTAAQLSDTRAISAAWMAHYSYVEEKFVEMASFIAVAIAIAEPDSHATYSRLSLVIASAYHFAGNFDLALPWYTKSREHSRAYGDESTLSALSYNLATRRSFYALRAAISNKTVESHVGLARIGLETSLRFDDLVGITSMPHWARLVHASLCSALGEYDRAVQIYDAYLNADAIKGALANHKPTFLADLAWCQLKVGNPDAAKSAGEAISATPTSVFPEDGIIIFGRLSQYYLELGDTGTGARYGEMAQECELAFQIAQSEVTSLLNAALNTSHTGSSQV